MNPDQILKHTVSLEASSTNQKVTNQTVLTDGGIVVVSSMNEINVPLDSIYDVAIAGDVNKQSLIRNFGLLNNLLGRDAFKFTALNESTDLASLEFSAVFDPELFVVSGTAQPDSPVLLILEDGSNKKTLADSLGAWKIILSDSDLQLGMNNLVAIGSLANQSKGTVTINYEKPLPVIPLDLDFTFDVNDPGEVITGVVQDDRVSVFIDYNGAVTEITPLADMTWSHTFAEAMTHADSLQIWVGTAEEMSVKQTYTHYIFSATISADGSGFTGTAAALSSTIVLSNTRLGTFQLTADLTGTWSYTFVEARLVNGETVTITENSVEHGTFTYTDVTEYNLTGSISDSTTLSGTTHPLASVSVQVTAGELQQVTANMYGAWTAVLTTALTDLQTVTVSSAGETDLVLTYDDPNVANYVFTANISDSLTMTGTAQPDSTITVTLPDTSTVTGTTGASGEWLITLGQALSNLDSITVNNGSETITLDYVEFTAQFISSTQIDGTALEGTEVTANGVTVTANAANQWSLTIAEVAPATDVTITTSTGASLTITYNV